MAHPMRPRRAAAEGALDPRQAERRIARGVHDEMLLARQLPERLPARKQPFAQRQPVPRRATLPARALLETPARERGVGTALHEEELGTALAGQRAQRVARPKPAPAPAPKALAERRSLTFAPQAQAIQPQVVNPTVIARAAPAVEAPKLDMKTVSSVTAPREISSAPLAVESVQAASSPVAATPSRVDLGAAGAPALRGPIERDAPVGASVGPRQVVASGTTVGTGSATTGDGSSVREGQLSSRDVLGSPDGPRLANVNTRVGQNNLKGPGGSGTVLGGGDPDCDTRPEVRAYMDQIKQRTLARWATAGRTPVGRVRAKLRFQVDAGGSASRVEMVTADDPGVGSSVVDALRAASPFPPMPDRVRCLAGSQLTATFTLETTSTAVAN